MRRKERGVISNLSLDHCHNSFCFPIFFTTKLNLTALAYRKRNTGIHHSRYSSLNTGENSVDIKRHIQGSSFSANSSPLSPVTSASSFPSNCGFISLRVTFVPLYETPKSHRKENIIRFSKR